MNLSTLIILVILAVIIGAVVRIMIRDKKAGKGCGGCAGGCGGCAGSSCAMDTMSTGNARGDAGMKRSIGLNVEKEVPRGRYRPKSPARNFLFII